MQRAVTQLIDGRVQGRRRGSDAMLPCPTDAEASLADEVLDSGQQATSGRESLLAAVAQRSAETPTPSASNHAVAGTLGDGVA